MAFNKSQAGLNQDIWYLVHGALFPLAGVSPVSEQLSSPLTAPTVRRKRKPQTLAPLEAPPV